MITLVFVLAQWAAPAAAGRPSECAFGDTGAPNVWERVKQPELGRYCDLLASGASRLVGDGVGSAREALAIADEADKRLPGRTSPTVLRGRAYVKLAQYTDAYAAFHAALAKDSAACDEPTALYALARAAWRTHHDAEALTAFHALLPRASGLPSQARSAAYIEAGLATMATGVANLDDAIAIFRQARREAQDALGVAATLTLALALDRATLRDEARAVLAERRIDSHALTDARVRDVFAMAPSDLDALSAMVAEGEDRNAASILWKKVAETATQPAWSEHAKSRDALLGTSKKQPVRAARDGGHE